MFSGFQCEEAAPQYLPLHRRQGPQGVCGEFTLETTILFLPDGVTAAFIVVIFYFSLLQLKHRTVKTSSCPTPKYWIINIFAAKHPYKNISVR